MTGKRFSVDDKYEAAVLYYQYGQYTKVEELSSGRFAARTVKYWHDNDPQFADGLKKAAGLADKRLGAKIFEAERLALKHVINSFKDKETSAQIKPRDAAWIAAVFHDKRLVLDGKATSISGSLSKGGTDQLDELAKQLEARAAKSAKAAIDLPESNITRFKSVK